MTEGGREQARIVDHIPILTVAPIGSSQARGVALWLPPFSAPKESTLASLQQLAGEGFVAISFDLWQHGERATETEAELQERYFGNFRRHGWPILGQSALDGLRVIDWAISEFETPRYVVAGGRSMGGDIAVTLAGIDNRVARVAGLVSSPDWTRPDMRLDASTVLPQGEADSQATWFYDHLNPMTHLDAYARGPAIAFENGSEDFHIPAEHAIRFKESLLARYPEAGRQIRVTVHPGVGHLDGGGSPLLLARCLTWLTDGTSPSEMASEDILAV